MTNDTRRHHYVAAFHLAHFTRGGGQKDPFFVFDLERQESYRQSPRTAGHERDFYRVEVEGVDPMVFERDYLGKVEGPASTAFLTLLGSARGALTLGLPCFRAEPQTLLDLLHFVAVQAVRGPRQRADVDRLTTGLATTMLQHLTQSQAGFDRRAARDPALRGLSRDEVREVLRDPSFRFTTDPTGHVGMFIGAVAPVLEALVPREWSIALFPPTTPPLICTDNPVLVLSPPGVPPGVAGFGTPGSEVIMPLGRDALLSGRWPGSSLGPRADNTVDVRPGAAEDVHTANALLVDRAHRFVYCADDDFEMAGLRGGVEGHTAVFSRARVGLRQRKKMEKRAARKRAR